MLKLCKLGLKVGVIFIPFWDENNIVWVFCQLSSHGMKIIFYALSESFHPKWDENNIAGVICQFSSRGSSRGHSRSIFSNRNQLGHFQ